LAGEAKSAFRFLFLYVSTDKVFGSLGPDDPAFTEASPYAPNSPYDASKAAADHLSRAYHHAYGPPVLTVAGAGGIRPSPRRSTGHWSGRKDEIRERP